MSQSKQSGSLPAIAVIGMSGRFPGARNVDEFWRNLCEGVEAISHFEPSELEISGDAAVIHDSRYVSCKAILEDVELFDASFFGYTPREAELADPQQRLFLQCAWEALENAGYDPQRYTGSIGLFGGSSFNHYLLVNLLSNRELIDSSGFLQTSIRNRTDHLTTNVAYKLNLKGPCVTVQTACSTSLVAAHMASQSLLNHECDIALAGGSSLSLPQKAGYLYQEGGILSPDGHCRAFDAKAQGTVTGSGVGIVVLKRLEDALADRDNIDAVILGSAIGNDGSSKVGYTAPSIDGQAQVIAEAQAVAGVEADSITYVEAHGTGTKMGDPIEVAALHQVFKERTQRKGFCALGSVKTNIGHLDTAAGVAGLIKTILSLKHKSIPPSLNFEQPNPEIDFTNSPFFVNTSLRAWNSQKPRRAGVSSFGIGGTNAHLVLQEAPAFEPAQTSRPYQLLVLSARTSTALESATTNLASAIEGHPELNIADVAFTLQAGRREFNHRRAVVCRDRDDALQALRTLDPRRATTGFYEPKRRPVTFMFPGQGAQYINMAKGLYSTEPGFRRHLDDCANELQNYKSGLDIRDVLFPANETDASAATARLNQTEVTQPALFVIEYALAQLWIEWGVQPEVMIGHSIGEYVAACLAGVLSVHDALMLIATRGRLMQALPAGGMVVVPLSEEDVRPMLKDGLCLAAVNGPAFCVISGPTEAIQKVQEELTAKAVACRRLSTSHAFHSSMMDPVLESFAGVCRKVDFEAPRIPYLSNLSGTWITKEQATDPGYWVRHLRETVRFADGIRELVKDPDSVLLEVGPGRTLATLARWNPYRAAGQVVLNSVRHPDDRVDDLAFLLTTMGKLWLAGVSVDWAGFHAGEQRRRVPLPTYPFEPQRYWIEPRKETHGLATPSKTQKRDSVTDWLYSPGWRRIPALSRHSSEESGRFLIFMDQHQVGERLIAALKARGCEVLSVTPGANFAGDGRNFSIRPGAAEDYQALFNDLETSGRFPTKIVHLWNLVRADGSRETAGNAFDLSFMSPVFIAQAIGALGAKAGFTELLLVSNLLCEVTGNPVVAPERALLTGPCRVIPQEYGNIRCRQIDLDVTLNQDPENEAVSRLEVEIISSPTDSIVAHRNGHRWVPTYEALQMDSSSSPLPVRPRGTYLITGGLGGLGLVFAEQLAEAAQARLVLTARSSFPKREHWEEWLEEHSIDDPVSAKIHKLQSLENMGANLMILSADAADETQMKSAIEAARRTFGAINGVIHAAGVPGGGVIQLKTRESAWQVIAPKVNGTKVLASLLRNEALDFFVACSSRSSILGGFGQADYCAANAFLDAFAHSSGTAGLPSVISINWDAWRDVGMLVNKAAQAGVGTLLPAKEPIGHPLLDTRSEESAQREIFTTTFSPLTHWVLDEHRIVGNAVIPGVAYLEMARAATEKYAGNASVEIRDAFFLAPLGLRDDEKREVRLLVEQESNGHSFRVISRPGEDSGGTQWHEYATGKIAFVPPSAPRQHDLAAIMERCNLRHVVLTDDSKRDEDLGPRWQALKRAYVGENELLAFLELPDQFAPELQELKLHPSLLDRATGTGKEFLIREGVYLPMGYRRLRMKRPLESKIWVHIRFRDNQDDKRQTITFDIVFMDEQGEELLDIEAFSQKRINDITAQVKVFANRSYRRNSEATEEARGQSSLANVYSEELQHGITPKEGREALRHILSLRGEQKQIIVSTRDLQASIGESGMNRHLASVLEKATKTASVQPLHERPELASSFAAADNDTEKGIAEVWQNILGIKEIGVHDNFFDLGGDSVQAIQIIAQINQLGFDLTPQQLFQHQTIADLAAIATASKAIHAEQGSVTGEVPLTPPQLCFLEQEQPSSHHHNHAVLLEAAAATDPQLISRAVQVLIEHHDVLRAQFVRDGNTWRQEIGAPRVLESFSVVELGGFNASDQNREFDAAIQRVQSSFNLEQGPLFRAVLFQFGANRPSRLLFSAHILVVDGTSMGILVEDFQTLYQQLSAGSEPKLPAKTTSYKQWAERLPGFAASSEVLAQARYWTSACYAVPPLSADLAGGENSVASVQTTTARLSVDETSHLLQDVTRAYRTQLNETLLFALSRTLAENAGTNSILVDVEGTGRDEVFADSSLTRTVGSFTSVTPALLEMPHQTSLAEAIKAVKEQVRGIPNPAISYGLLRYLAEDPMIASAIRAIPQASVRFNHLGQLELPVRRQAAFWPLHDVVAYSTSPRAHRQYWFEVTTSVFQGELHVAWTFSSALHRPDTVARLLEGFMNTLRSLIANAETVDASAMSPSDFPLAQLDEQNLEKLKHTLENGPAANQMKSGIDGEQAFAITKTTNGNGHLPGSNVKTTLLQHPSVAQALVSRDDDGTGKVTAYVVLRPEYRKQSKHAMKFGLFYFADSNSLSGGNKYRLYMDGAKFADQHGFTSIWTPERHFHPKGGLYPNPSVLSSALATITERIHLRAGSVVMPLHNPLRVAEEWSIVDNLSGGRAGISFVSGWVPNDFAFFPERYANKREEMFRGIEQVRKLWRGEKITTLDGVGKITEIGVFPKPIQAELPIWLTCSKGAEMFIKAGEHGFNVLTSLQAQNIDEVTSHLGVYRQAREKAGYDPDGGEVVMMKHTFLGSDKPTVVEKVREPLTNFLRSHIDLIKTFTSSHEIDAGLDKKEVVDSVAAFAFERYYRTASLIGTPQSCRPMVDRLKAIGVTEIASLIDFGVDVDTALSSLVHLDALRRLCEGTAVGWNEDQCAALARYLEKHLTASEVPTAIQIVDELPVQSPLQTHAASHA